MSDGQVLVVAAALGAMVVWVAYLRWSARRRLRVARERLLAMRLRDRGWWS